MASSSSSSSSSSSVFFAELCFSCVGVGGGEGVKREELNVHVEDGNILQISGERTREEEESTDTWHRAERRRGSFLRRFRLPLDADMDAVRCSLDHGVLTVTVPKREAAAVPQTIRAVDIATVGD